jgi:hypothetical protein
MTTNDEKEADIRLLGLTVGNVQRDPDLRKLVAKILSSRDYELVMPPDKPKIGDEYLENGVNWRAVNEELNMFKNGLSESSYIVRRCSEHRRMYEFFFGKNKRE